ncbi:PqqD family protein [Candidatus Bathyarchaeota archaeon]|nr:PqqD family protein [Candidatus Bathyarchaeota archaeon]
MLEKDSLSKLVMRLADNQFLYRLDDSLMWLFNTETGEHWNLNEPSYFALSLFDGKRTVGEIQQLDFERYSQSGVSQEVIMEDFKSLIDQFITAEVITKN